jgi:hypothetical protein
MQARLEEEEANKAALVERINRLTRLILVSTQDFRDDGPSKVPYLACFIWSRPMLVCQAPARCFSEVYCAVQ